MRTVFSRDAPQPHPGSILRERVDARRDHAAQVQLARGRAVGHHAVGAGGTGTAPPYLAVVAALATLLLGSAAQAQWTRLTHDIPLPVTNPPTIGVQMNLHSTLVSYLHKLLVLLTGNFGKKGAGYRPSSLVARAFGGTTLLIVVGVAMDTVQQVESQLIMRHYDGFMKKARIRGRRG